MFGLRHLRRINRRALSKHGRPRGKWNGKRPHPRVRRPYHHRDYIVGAREVNRYRRLYLKYKRLWSKEMKAHDRMRLRVRDLGLLLGRWRTRFYRLRKQVQTP